MHDSWHLGTQGHCMLSACPAASTTCPIYLLPRFELLLVFTAGTGYEKGASWMSMLKVSVSDDGAEAVTRSQRLWGASLWNDTVAKPMDVGCDHATLDDAGRVWCARLSSAQHRHMPHDALRHMLLRTP